ncbi:DoxX family protein [Pseudoduganella albidiflava]|uniref:DoxX family protein n=1 Tax=Pseudoduganella albidiflava TaxID=321983 RepID=A0A411WVI9_9BURK|nr:DoxX family protein [Pseudoduganella albidiflava]QBI00811.1 DoxX family protein [Pseudoduganella albidiflava]GGY30578.1 LysR family transcriptional regulator [Pseudoduganella albidiflava]
MNAFSANSFVPAIGRVLLATIFIFSAIGKIAAPEATIAYIQSVGLPFATLGLAIAIAVELGGGLLLVLGIKARAVAALLAVFSIVTGLAFHSAIGDQNQLIHLLKNFAMAGGLLQVVAFGAGAFSVDQRLARPAARQFA